MKPTRLQKLLGVYIKYSRLLIVKLITWHEVAAEKGVGSHPCWAGGFGPEGVTSQPCDTCDPFNKEATWAFKLRRAGEIPSREAQVYLKKATGKR